MDTVVSAAWLHEQLHTDQLVVVDTRYALNDHEAGRLAYEDGHILGAVFLDVGRELAGPKREDGVGGRHPLPEVSALAAVLGSKGIDSQTTVVAYDDQGGAMAARLWWLLSYMGHEGDIHILDGGYSGWVKDGYVVSTDHVELQPKRYVPHVKPDMLADIEEVRRKAGQQGVVLIDSREPARYRGEVEPIDRAAGHIPGAINRFWQDGKQPNGTWKSSAEQAERFRDLSREDEIIVYCGSGITATPNVLALQAAGFRNVKLYAGSWSDWISHEDNPIATGE